MKIAHIAIIVLTLCASGYLGSHPVFSQMISAKVLPNDVLREPNTIDLSFTLDDYFSEEIFLEKTVNDWYQRLNEDQKIGQVIMPSLEANNQGDINDFIISGGGLVMTLKKEVTQETIEQFIDLNEKHNITPLLIASDAEPSLMKYRFPDTGKNFKNTNQLTDQDSTNYTATQIAEFLKSRSINLNFAPVYDNNKNQTVIGDRSFGTDKLAITPLAKRFFKTLHRHNIIATAKHFPGHGNVSGDTHETLQTITGKLEELETFKQAISDGILVMMVGHLNVNTTTYNTNGKPATLSPEIMQDLLREKFKFKGLIVTDAMNMGALNSFEDSDLETLVAGADIALIPRDWKQLKSDIKKRLDSDPVFRDHFEDKVKRVLRLKLVWNLSQNN